MYRVDRYMMLGESENLLNFANSKIISGCSVNFQMAAVGCTIMEVFAYLLVRQIRAAIAEENRK